MPFQPQRHVGSSWAQKSSLRSRQPAWEVAATQNWHGRRKQQASSDLGGAWQRALLCLPVTLGGSSPSLVLLCVAGGHPAGRHTSRSPPRLPCVGGPICCHVCHYVYESTLWQWAHLGCQALAPVLFAWAPLPQRQMLNHSRYTHWAS